MTFLHGSGTFLKVRMIEGFLIKFAKNLPNCQVYIIRYSSLTLLNSLNMQKTARLRKYFSNYIQTQKSYFNIVHILHRVLLIY